MKKPKITIFSLYFDPFIGGAEIATKNIFSRLTQEYEIELITSRPSYKVPQKEKICGITVYRVGFPKFHKINYVLFGFLKGLFQKQDLIWCQEANQSTIIARLLYLFKKTPTIVNIQSGLTEEEIKKKIGKFYFLYKGNYTNKFSYQVISSWLEKRCKKHNIKKIIKIPNGFDTKLFYVKKTNTPKIFNKDKKYIITTSRLSKKNGLFDLISSLSYLPKKYELIILGIGELEKELFKHAAKKKVIQRTHFLGHVAQHELVNYLQHSFAFCRPSLSEGFGNSFIEAMACGIPVIATPVGGIPDFIKNDKNGLLVRVHKPKEIAQAVQQFENKTLRERIVKESLLTSKKYSWDLIAKKTNKHIRSKI